jgi:hypothetical protein
MGDNTARKRERDTEKEKRLTKSEIEELIKSGILKTDEEKREKVIKDLKFWIKAFEKLPKEKEKYEKLLKEVMGEAVDKYSLEKDKERLKELEERYEKCKKSCDELNKEKTKLKDLVLKDEILDIALDDDKKLIDLLIERILDASDEWKSNIDTLINIPTSTKGEKMLRGGDYFEALFQLAIAINIIPEFQGRYIRFYDIKGYKNLNLMNNYLYTKTIKNSGGGEQGISDISFEVSTSEKFEYKASKSYDCGEKPYITNETSNPYYFVSVKGYKKEKSIKSEYDVPLLDSQLKIFPEILNKKIIVCVRNKEQFLTNLSRSKINFLKNTINYVFGYDEIIEYFSQFRISFFNKISKDISKELIENTVKELFQHEKIIKPMLNLYFHQQLVVDSVIERIKEVNIKEKPHYMCIGVLPRGGKSFIAGGIIDLHKKIKNKESGYNVLFLTSAVNETKKQFREDLIEKFSEFSDFDFIDVVNDTKNGEGKNKFYFISRQLSSKETTEEQNDIGEKIKETSIIDNKIDISKQLERKLGFIPDIDICFFDEAHVGILADTVRKNFDITFSKFKMPIIMMTATYKKPANLLNSPNDLFVWDLQDIKDMKSLPELGIENFKIKNPDVLIRYDNAERILRDRIKNGETLYNLAKPYLQFPKPNFISLTFTQEAIQRMIDSGVGYNYQKAFEINVNLPELLDITKYKEWGKQIRNRDEALKIRQFLTPEQSEDDNFLIGKNRKFRALNQIFNIAQKNNSRPIQGKAFSMLMFLPFGFTDSYGEKVKIGELCRIWASFMYELSYWKDNFIFLTLSKLTNKLNKPSKITLEKAIEKGICQREEFDGDLKDIIINLEREALKHDKGLVILSGDVAKMGISLKCVDVVCMMTDSKDADDIIQKMYRALTDDPPHKKDGFIIDLNIKRIIEAIFDYDRTKDRLRKSLKDPPTTNERLFKTFELCNWGQDEFIEDHPEKSFDDIMNDIKDKVINSLEAKIFTDFDTNVRKIKQKQIEILQKDHKLYMDLWSVIGQTADSKNKPSEKGKLEYKRAIAVPDELSNELKEESSNLAPQLEQSSVSIPEGEIVEPNIRVDEKPILTEEQIKSKIQNLIVTFVNALVIKSAEPWSKTLNLTTLLAKYKEDKKEIYGKEECECSKESNCKSNHDNLYQTAFCELNSYAFEPEGKNDLKYNKDIHREIMDLIDEIFKNPILYDEWNLYIESLLKKINESKKITKKGGFKKYTYKIRDGVRVRNSKKI